MAEALVLGTVAKPRRGGKTGALLPSPAGAASRECSRECASTALLRERLVTEATGFWSASFSTGTRKLKKYFAGRGRPPPPPPRAAKPKVFA